MTTRVLSGNLQGVSAAVDLLRSGDVVALPTETVYGLAARALDPFACAKIFEAKSRPLDDPLIVHLPSIEWLERIVEVSPTTRELAEKFWPGPLTLVVPRKPCVPDIVTSGQATVAVRMSAHPLFASVVSTLDEPLAAPSANRFGRISPTSAADVLDELDGRIPLILDGGSCRHGIESTIYDVGNCRILRAGPISAEQLGVSFTSSIERNHVVVPGSLPSHYAPQTPLYIVKGMEEVEGEGNNPKFPIIKRTGCLCWNGALLSPENRATFASVEILSETGDLCEAATNLYAAMRRLDNARLDSIAAISPPRLGIGIAIADRLERAAFVFTKNICQSFS